MTAAALGRPFTEVSRVVDDTRRHPMPCGRDSDDTSALLKRSVWISVLLHLLLVTLGVAIHLWQPAGLVGTPQSEVMNVTIIPLSALDTILPKGAPIEQKQEPESLAKEKPLNDVQKKEQPRQEPKKIVAMKSIAPQKVKPESALPYHSSNSHNSQPATSGSQLVGVPDGQANSLEEARISYQDMVATLLARSKRYPERALKRRMTGEGTIRIEISSDGSLSDFSIVRSTNTPVLDEELRAMVERASPFPAFPTDLRKNSLALVVPIAFRLES